jgi:hypothetical protein
VRNQSRPTNPTPGLGRRPVFAGIGHHDPTVAATALWHVPGSQPGNSDQHGGRRYSERAAAGREVDRAAGIAGEPALGYPTVAGPLKPRISTGLRLRQGAR